MKPGKFGISDVQCAEDGNGTGSGLLWDMECNVYVQLKRLSEHDY
jgi:hypothetical protein